MWLHHQIECPPSPHDSHAAATQDTKADVVATARSNFMMGMAPTVYYAEWAPVSSNPGPSQQGQPPLPAGLSPPARRLCLARAPLPGSCSKSGICDPTRGKDPLLCQCLAGKRHTPERLRLRKHVRLRRLLRDNLTACTRPPAQDTPERSALSAQRTSTASCVTCAREEAPRAS